MLSSCESRGSQPMATEFSGSGRGFRNLRYHRWQTRLLLVTSLVMLGTATFACFSGQYVTATFGSLSSVASLNYWRAPGISLRRDIDVILAVACLVYFLLAACLLTGFSFVSAWSFFAAFGYCFRKSWIIAATTEDTWAKWHACGHIAISLAATSVILGEGDNWLLRRTSQ